MRSPVCQLSDTKGDEGYTLTEMLVVIGIICLIAAVLTPSLMGQLGRARVKAAGLQLQNLAAAVESFHSDVGRYPTQPEGLTALVNQPADTQGWAGPYLRDARALQDPWNHPLIYKVEADGQHFYIETLGADGKPGGSGTAADIREPPR